MIWIVTPVLLIMFGNRFWLLPSRAERRRMTLHNQALKEGLFCHEVRSTEKLPKLADPSEGLWPEYYLLLEFQVAVKD